MMVTRTANKQAGRGIKDQEVKTAYHDEVLNWLIDNLDVVAADRWGLHDVAEEVKSAKDSARTWIERTVAVELQDFGSGKRVPYDSFRVMRGETGKPFELAKNTKEALLAAASRVPLVLGAIDAFKASDGAGSASVKSFEVMKRLQRIERKGAKGQTITEAGYVDLEARLFVPDGLRFWFDGLSSEKTYESGLDDEDEDDVQFLKAADGFSPEKVQTKEVGDEIDVWFSVRTSTFTLGEILQELKELQSLGGGENEVALVVDGIEDRMRELIEREGFVVINRDDYQRASA
jgi:hypothetical protein